LDARNGEKTKTRLPFGGLNSYS